jgi:hypothetical protein
MSGYLMAHLLPDLPEVYAGSVGIRGAFRSQFGGLLKICPQPRHSMGTFVKSLEYDSEFVPLHDDPEFHTMVATIRKRVGTSARCRRETRVFL